MKSSFFNVEYKNQNFIFKTRQISCRDPMKSIKIQVYIHKFKKIIKEVYLIFLLTFT